MTKTTNTLAELVPRFEKPRGDGNALKKGVSTEAERGVDKTTFAHLVKHKDGKAERAEVVANQADKAPGASEQGAQDGRSVERDADTLQPQMESGKSPMQLGAKLVSTRNAIDPTDAHVGKSTDEADAAPRTKGLASAAAGVAIDRDVRAEVEAEVDADAAVDEVVAGRLDGAGQTEPVKAAGAAEMHDTPKLDDDVAVRQTVDAEQRAPQMAANQDETVPRDQERMAELPERMPSQLARVPNSGAASARRNDVSGERAAPVIPAQLAADAVAQGEAGATSTQRLNPVAKTDITQQPGADGPPLRLNEQGQPTDIDGVERTGFDSRRAEPMAGRSANDIKPLSVDRAAAAAPTAALADDSAVRRLADVAQALRRTPDRPPSASARLDGAAENSATIVERVVLQAPAELPEQRARRAFEAVTMQRSLVGREPTPAAEDGIEVKAPDLSNRGAQREGVLPATASPVATATTSVANIYGQLVQSIASTDGLPKSRGEFRLLAMQNGAGATPQLLRVLQLQLQPKELGEVAVRIALRGDKLELRVQAARQATADLIKSDQRVLVEALQQKNFDVDSVTIQVVDPDRNAGNQPGLPNGAQGRAGQGDSFHAASQGQTPGQNGGTGKQDGNGEADRRDPAQDGQTANVDGGRHDIYL